MQETLILVADPEIPRTVRGAGKHLSVLHGVYENKPAILKVGNPARHRNPNSPAIVLSEGLHSPIRQSATGYLAHGAEDARLARRDTPAEFLFSPDADAHGLCASLTVNRNLVVIPSVQALIRGQPNASIPGRQNGSNAVGQTLSDRDRGDGEVAKAVQAVSCCDPNIAFTILKEIFNKIA
jgi:hypothetical protein